MDWELFYKLSKTVAKKIRYSNYSPDLIVGLARGGWVLARVLCDLLRVKDLVSLKVEHWGVTATPNGKAKLKYSFQMDLKGKRILVVDDITDTGESMMLAVEHVKTMNPSEVRTATLRHINGSKFTPDYFGDEITWRWVIFPWNYVEDMCNILPRVVDKCKNLREIKETLKRDFKIEVEEEKITEILNELKYRSRGEPL
ncbi:phosphoribosyltransferase [Candidatus Bathyarchaeota archaeon]|nr:phosphoribosyltransferase [Candidatus Bathyarchaeota archaeon]MBS7630827.1 phosphoribosyltransferase [Candidatus Bathyarchaeota archaeon]